MGQRCSALARKDKGAARTQRRTARAEVTYALHPSYFHTHTTATCVDGEHEPIGVREAFPATPCVLGRPGARRRYLTIGFKTTLPSFSVTSKSIVRPAYFALSCASVLFSCATTFSYSRPAAAASPRRTRSLT